jgi:hypothetical protein
MVAGVKKLARDWSYDAVSIGYPGPVLHAVRSLNRTISPADGSGSISQQPSVAR